MPESVETSLPEEEIREEKDLESGELGQISDEEAKERDDIERFIESVRRERAEKAEDFEEQIPPSPEGEEEEDSEYVEEEIAEEQAEEREAEEEIGEQQKILDLEEEEKRDIERFVKSVRKEREEKADESLTSEEEPPLSPEGMEEKTSEIEDALPPWAEKIKESPPPEFEDTEEERKIEESPELEEEFHKVEEKVSEEELSIPEVEVGLPEKVEQDNLPFEEEIEEGGRRVKRRRPSRLSIWLKSRAFDLFSIAILWLVSLWIASRVIGVTLFELISVSTLPVIAFYLILLVVYFSFFFLFLGETLGDYLFPQE